MRPALLVGAAVLAAACTRGHPALPVRSLPPPPPGGLAVTLVWDAPVDLDLYVTDPGLETVYFANPRTRSGGVLEHDSRCADGLEADRSERIRWTDPPPGRYRVGVDFLEPCRRRVSAAVYRVRIESGGQTLERTARARVAVRETHVLEFTVREGGGVEIAP